MDPLFVRLSKKKYFLSIAITLDSFPIARECERSGRAAPRVFISRGRSIFVASSRRRVASRRDSLICTSGAGIAVDSMETTAHTCRWNNNGRVMQSKYSEGGRTSQIHNHVITNRMLFRALLARDPSRPLVKWLYIHAAVLSRHRGDVWCRVKGGGRMEEGGREGRERSKWQ